MIANARPMASLLPLRRASPLVIALVAIVAIAAIVVITLGANASIERARDEARQRSRILDVAHARASEKLTPVPGPAAPLADAIDRVLRERNIAYRHANREGSTQGEAIVIDAVRFDALVGALDSLMREHHVRAAEANVAARVEPGVVRADLVLTR
jgi:type II secretory pathway component PulM